MMLRRIAFLATALAVFFIAHPVSAQTCGSAGTPGTGLCPMVDNGLPAKLGSLPVMPANATSTVTLGTLAMRLYYVDDFGAVGDVITAGLSSATDDTTAINNALAQASTNGGGLVCLNPTKAYKANSGNITVPYGVSLDGCGGPLQSQNQLRSSTVNYTAWAGTLYINPTYTISLAGTIQNMHVLTSTLTTSTTYRQLVTMVAAYSGTGITFITTSPPTPTDASVRNATVGGFATCITSTNLARPVLSHVNVDCTNGVNIVGMHDTGRLEFVEAYPFLTQNPNFQFYSVAISGVADNGSGVYRYTTATNSFVTGDTVWVYGVGGAQGANTKCSSITVIDTTHFDCTGVSDAPMPTGITVSGSNYVTVSSTNGLVGGAGQGISGANIPGGATIQSVWPTAGAISISANATGSASGTSLTVTNSAYTSGGTAAIDPNQRSGTGIFFGNGEALLCNNCAVIDYNINYHVGSSSGTGGGWFTCTGCVSDGNLTLLDPTSIGVLIDGAAYAVNWHGGYTSSLGEAIVVNTSNTTKPNVFEGVNINNGNGMLIEHDSGVLLIENSGTNEAIYLGFGSSITYAGLSGNWFPSALAQYASSTVQALVNTSADNNAPSITPGKFVGNTGPLTSSGVLRGSSIFSTGGSFTSAAASTDYQTYCSGCGTDQKYWDFLGQTSGNLTIRAINDAYNASVNAMLFTRGAGYNATAISMLTGASTGVATQALGIDSTQHIRVGNTTIPTIASGACGATTNGTIASGSNDHSGTVQIGSASTTTCTISFGSTWVTAPRACLISPANSTAAAQGTALAYAAPGDISATQFIIHGSALASANYSYACF